MPELLIRTMTGKTVNINGNFKNTDELKSKICERIGTPPNKQALLYNNACLIIYTILLMIQYLLLS